MTPLVSSLDVHLGPSNFRIRILVATPLISCLSPTTGFERRDGQGADLPLHVETRLPDHHRVVDDPTETVTSTSGLPFVVHSVRRAPCK